MFRLLSRFVVPLPFLISAGTIRAQRAPRTSPIPLQISGQVRYAQGGRPGRIHHGTA